MYTIYWKIFMLILSKENLALGEKSEYTEVFLSTFQHKSPCFHIKTKQTNKNHKNKH